MTVKETKDNKAVYLSGSVHYLTKKHANGIARPNDEIRQDCNGLYSVYRLTDKPVQHGQVKWEKQNAETSFT